MADDSAHRRPLGPPKTLARRLEAALGRDVRQVLLAVAVAVAFVWELKIVLGQPIKLLTSGGEELHGGLEQIVKPFFAHYMLPFEVTALLLLVAMIGVVLLSKKEVK